VDCGLFAFTVKHGDGSEWSTVKLNLRRHFTYWQPESLDELLREAGWLVPHLQTVSLAVPWLFVIARRPNQ
jgi:hypothetical protein